MHHATDDRAAFLQVARCREEMKVELDAVYRNLFQHVQRGIAAAEVVHFHLEAHRPQLFCGADQHFGFLDVRSLGDLDAQLVGCQAIRLDQVEEMLRNIVVFLNVVARHIHRNGPSVSLLVPPMEVIANPLPDETVQIEDEPGLLERRDEVERVQPAQLGVVPPAQSLCPRDRSRRIIHLRLIPDLDISGFNRRRKVVDDFRDPLPLLPPLQQRDRSCIRSLLSHSCLPVSL